MIWRNLTLTGSVVWHQILVMEKEPDLESESDQLGTIRINMIICIVLNTLELLSRFKIFDFFAHFVEQLKAIV